MLHLGIKMVQIDRTKYLNKKEREKERNRQKVKTSLLQAGVSSSQSFVAVTKKGIGSTSQSVYGLEGT